MVMPRDPEEFKAKVLRRAVQIERRRRRARVLMAAPAVVAVLLAGALVVQRADDGGNDTTGVAAGVEAEGLFVEEVPMRGGTPWAAVGGVDGVVRVLIRSGDGGGGASQLARIDGDEVTVVELPSSLGAETIVAGTDRSIWMTDPTLPRVVRVGDDGSVETYDTESVPSASGTWLDGRFWFTEPALDRITGLAPDGSQVHHAVPPGRAPSMVTTGPDGSLWFASSAEARIGSVSTSGAVNELDLDDDGERAVVMAPGPGPSLWMVLTGPAGTRLARLDANGRVVGEQLSVARVPLALSLGPDGRLWFTSGGTTVHQRSVTGLTIGDLGRTFHADSWALVGDESMWAVDRTAGTLVRITASG